MKILVLGCNGQLGRCLNDQLLNTDHEVTYTSREQIDITDFEQTNNQFLKISPDLIINATAYTAVDKAEEDQKAANLINHLAVENIANISIKRNILKVPRIGDHIWYISNLSKFKKHYPNWKQKYNTKKIIEDLISSEKYI